jgi:hypothetical protein
MVDQADKEKHGTVGRILGVVALVVSATAAFAALQSSLNKIWRVEAEPGRAVVRYLLTRAVSLALIAAFRLPVAGIAGGRLRAGGDRRAPGWRGIRTHRARRYRRTDGFVRRGHTGVRHRVQVPARRSRAMALDLGGRIVHCGALFGGQIPDRLYITKTGAGDAFGAGGR